MRVVLALAIGYLLGSVLPADLFARAKGIDIRAVGTRNPGATNALGELGVVPGLVTGAYDASVGLIAMYVAHLLGLAEGWIYLAGAAAIVGHCFPVFFGFRGGQGMAATTGMLIYGIGVALFRGWLSATGMGVLILVATAVFVLTRSATDVGVFVAPLLAVEVLLGGAGWRFATFMCGLAGFIWLVQLGIARRDHLLRLSDPARARLARIRLKG